MFLFRLQIPYYTPKGMLVPLRTPTPTLRNGLRTLGVRGDFAQKEKYQEAP